MTEHFAVEWRNCEVHCWCALDAENYPEWSVSRLFIKTMKETKHDHGDSSNCTGCMVLDGRLTFNIDHDIELGRPYVQMGVDPGKGDSIGVTVEVPPPWKEGDPAPPDATHLFDGSSTDQ